MFTPSQAGDVARVGLDLELLDPGAHPRRPGRPGPAPAGRRQRGGARHGGAGARQAAEHRGRWEETDFFPKDLWISLVWYVSN